MKASVTREYSWSMVHALLRHRGKCFTPHGHNYRMEVEVSGPVNERSGMVLDFSELDTWVKPLIDRHFDHAFWANQYDERFPHIAFSSWHDEETCDSSGVEPTAENLALWFWDVWKEFPPHWHAWKGINLERITIYETDRSSTTVRRT